MLLLIKFIELNWYKLKKWLFFFFSSSNCNVLSLFSGSWCPSLRLNKLWWIPNNPTLLSPWLKTIPLTWSISPTALACTNGIWLSHYLWASTSGRSLSHHRTCISPYWKGIWRSRELCFDSDSENHVITNIETWLRFKHP